MISDPQIKLLQVAAENLSTMSQMADDYCAFVILGLKEDGTAQVSAIGNMPRPDIAAAVHEISLSLIRKARDA